MQSTVTVTCEQAVYGSFPFRDQGYDILTATAGCKPEWIEAFARYCRELGQPPSEVAPLVDHLLFARKIPSGPWVVALGSAQGCDDRGRPGAWAFHCIFLSNRDYGSIGATPFALRPLLTDRFYPGMILDSGPADVVRSTEPSEITEDPAKIRWISRGRKLRYVSSQDTFAVTERFWHSLGIGTRKRRSLTTWSFRSDTPFHWSCISFHRPAEALELQDRSTWFFSPDDVTAQPTPARSGFCFRYFRAGIGAVAIVPLILWSCALLTGGKQQQVPTISGQSFHEPDAPPRAVNILAQLPADVRVYLKERLTDWAERLEANDVENFDLGIGTVASNIVRAMRYDGPMITGELAIIDAETERIDVARIYKDTIASLATIRTWPEGADMQVEKSPLHALATLAWCVRSDELMHSAEKIRTVSEARLWFDRLRSHIFPPSIPPELPSTGMESRFPELTEYRLHLSRVSRIR